MERLRILHIAMGSKEKSSKNKKIPTRQDEMSHPVGFPKSRFLLQHCSLLCFPFPNRQRIRCFLCFIFPVIPNAESIDLPAVHQHFDRFIRIASAESDESHQCPAVASTCQLDSKIRRISDHIAVNNSFFDECEVDPLFKFQKIRSLDSVEHSCPSWKCSFSKFQYISFAKIWIPFFFYNSTLSSISLH